LLQIPQHFLELPAIKIQLAGDLAGAAAAPAVSKIKGIDLPASAPTAGQVLTATGTTATGWQTPASAPVSSVNAHTGAVVLAKTDVGLGNVDNTNDLGKPISATTQTALDAKAPLASPTFMGTVTVPTPTNATDASTKAYVDSAAATGTPDANGSTKGKLQLAGDLTGTATSPIVAKVNGVVLPGSAPTAGQVLTATSASATNWATPTAAPVVSVAGKTGVVTLTAADAGAIPTTDKGSASGVATLDGTTHIPAAQLPDLSGSYPRVFTPEAYGALGDGTTDDTAGVQAAINAAQVSGGEVRFGSKTYRCNGQIAIPNDGATTYPRQKSMRWVGSGSYSDPKGGGAPFPDLTAVGGTILDLRYSGGGFNFAKIDTRGKGLFEATGITFTDLGTSSNPFIKTTNTTLHFHSNAFVGNPTKYGTTCDQDAFILGGLDISIAGGSGPDAAFQGYGTVINQNYFARIRRAVLMQAWCNATVFRDNNIWQSCGSNLSDGAAIELFPGTTNGYIIGNVVDGNLIEVSYYPYGIKLTDYALGNTISNNSMWDPSGVTLYCVYAGTTNVRSNCILPGYGDLSARAYLFEQTPGLNNLLPGMISTTQSQFAQIAAFRKGIATGALYNLGAGVGPEIALGQGTNPPGIYVINGSTPPAFAAPVGSICIVKGSANSRVIWLKVNGTSTTGWNLFSSTVLSYQIKTTNYAISETEGDNVVVFNGASLTATLPQSLNCAPGRRFTIKNIYAGNLTIATTSSQTIDGTAPGFLAQWGILRVVSDGANWLTI